MYTIRNKIIRTVINDSEIIQDVESAKEIPGFDINLGCDDRNWSLLMTIVYWNRKELVRYLLSIPGINVNQGDTVMQICNQISILKLLLDHKDIDINMQNNRGETGLHRVCRWGHEACVKEYLLDARVDTSIRDWNRETALDESPS